MHLPSAGMSRFRFNGSASLHLSPKGHPEVKVSIVPSFSSASAKSWMPIRSPLRRAHATQGIKPKFKGRF
jgi:hypothetical protein